MEIIQVVYHILDVENELSYMDYPRIEHAPEEVSLLALERLGREEVGSQNLNNCLVVLFSLISIYSGMLIKYTK